MRASVLLDMGGQQFLIDAGPDFRMQALRHGITRLDALLLTHAHHDHTGGIDDLRPIHHTRKTPLPVLLSSETAQELKNRYYYLFEPVAREAIPCFQLHLLPNQAGSVIFEHLPIHYVTYTQGKMQVNGYRIGDFAYLSDIRHFLPSILDHLQGLKCLIISALRYTSSPLHFSVDEAIDFAAQLRAEKVWLTHLSHDLEHQRTSAYLPPHVRLAYDGLEIDLDGG